MIWTAIFAATLALALLAVWHWGGRRIKGAGIIVALAWGANLMFVLMTGDYVNWRFMFVVDVVAAAAVLTPPCNASRLVIGVLYIAQISFHGVFGWYALRGLEGPSAAYLSGLYVLGLAQIAFLVIGAANDWSRKRHHRRCLVGGGAIPAAPLLARDGDTR